MRLRSARRDWDNGGVTDPDARGDSTDSAPGSDRGEADYAQNLSTIRRSYVSGTLTEDVLYPTWLEQLTYWYDQAAEDARIPEPNAMQVATADADGRPDIRTVLARGFDAAGVVFYTNYGSAKGTQLAANPAAAAVFAWLPLERQVRFRGAVTRVSAEETARYFAGRPRVSQLAAWASPQSQRLRDRNELDESLAEVTQRFGNGEILPPPNWGGYRIAVDEIEFWQGREFRLHDRLRFRRQDGNWLVERLAP